MNKLLQRPALEDHSFVQGAGGAFVAELAKFEKEIKFKVGDVLFREGQYADKFNLNLEGTVAIEADISPGGEPVLIQNVQAGDVLGWSWFYAPYIWHFSARARSDGKALVFNAPALLVHAEENPVFGYQLTKRLTGQLILRLQQIRRLLLMNIAEGHPAAEHSEMLSSRIEFPDRVWHCHHNKE